MKPKIRFKKFEGKWKYKLFSETFEILKNNSLSRSELADYGRVKNVHYGDILIKFEECLELVSIDLPFIKDEIVAKKLLQRCPLKNGDVVFADAAEDNTVGKCSEIVTARNESVVSGLHTIPCRPKFDFAERYLGYFLNSSSFHDQLLSHIQGTKISSISRKAMTNTNIYYPSDIKEQKDLSKFFKFLNSLISISTSRLVSLKQMKAASLQSMFPQEGETTPQIRFKGFEEEWKKTSFKDITSPAGIKNKENLPLESYSISNEFGFVPQNEQFENGGTMSSADKRMYYIVSPNSFAYNPARINVGSLGYYNGNENVIVSSLYEVFKTNNSIDDYFLLYWFKTDTFQRMIEQYQEGGVRLYFFYDKLCKCIIKVPLKAEQQKIADYFKTLDRQITLQTLRLEKLKQIKTTCLDKMFV